MNAHLDPEWLEFVIKLVERSVQENPVLEEQLADLKAELKLLKSKKKR